MERTAYIERVDPIFTYPDCARLESGLPVLHGSYLDALKSLAEDVVTSLAARLKDADDESNIETKQDLYRDICHGGPLSDYYVYAVRVLSDGTVVDDEGNVYWPRR